MDSLGIIFSRLAAKAPELARSTAQARVARIDALMKALLDRKNEAFAAGHAEMGLSETDVIGQLIIIKAEADFARRHLADWMKPRHVPNSMMSLGKKAWIQHEAKGVVLNLSTWNAPLAIGLVPAIAAIAAGNAVLLKPSELAPHSAALLGQIVTAAMPADEFAVVEGGAEVAQDLLKLPFNHVYYTGGQRVGRMVMRAAARHFAGVTLEMGGKNPAFVDASASITDAARKIAWGRLSNAGQVCVAPDYVLVHRAVAPQFIATIALEITRMYNPLGKGFEHSPDYPRLISQGHFNRVQGLINDAVAQGAKVETGGQADAASRFIPPTVLTGVHDGMAVMQEEIFGPVLPIAVYDDLQAALAGVRSRAKPLALYIYAQDRAMIDTVLAGTSAGSTVINHNMVQSGTNPHLPFGGINGSGMGRVGGERGFQEFSNARSVMEETSASSGLTPLPPFDAKTRKMMASMLTRDTVLPPAMLSIIETVLKLRGTFRRAS